MTSEDFTPSRPYGGVREVMLNFLAELDLTLALSGYSSLKSLDRSALVREA